jgi:hypothetical protein
MYRNIIYSKGFDSLMNYQRYSEEQQALIGRLVYSSHIRYKVGAIVPQEFVEKLKAYKSLTDQDLTILSNIGVIYLSTNNSIIIEAFESLFKDELGL